MISKLLFVVTIVNLWLGTSMELPRTDLIILESGEKIEGHIQTILDGVIKIDTGQGEKTVIREVNIYSPRDIVETGIVKTTRHAGHVKYLGKDSLKIETSSGMFTVKRALVRKILISHETLLPPLDL